MFAAQVENMRKNFEGRMAATESELGVDLPAVLPVDLKGAILAAGTPMVPYVAATSVGSYLNNSRSSVIRWPAGVQTAVWTSVDLPLDVDTSYPITVRALVSKSGATATDVPALAIGVYAQLVGALHDASANLGGTTPALTSLQAALPAKTITQLSLPIYLPPTPPARLSISINPTGTDVTDDVVLDGVWIEFMRKPGVARALMDIRYGILAAGTPMAAFGASVGVTLANAKCVGVEWAATHITAVWGSFPLPLDMDVTKPSVVVMLLSKTGATVGDTSACVLSLFEQIPGALEDAGSNLLGTATPIAAPSAAAKTVSKTIFGVAPNTFTAGPANCSFSITPGTLTTDNLICEGLWLEYQRTQTGATGAAPVVNVDLKASMLAAGTPMAAWANNAGASAPGVTLNNAKAVGVKWNNFATQTPVFSDVVLPDNLDTNQPIVVHALVSKSGATATDNTTLDIGVFEQAPGALEDATSGSLGVGGTTSALVGSLAAKTVSHLTFTIPAKSLTAAPGRLTISVQPTNGSNLTDDVLVTSVFLTYAGKTG